jgi:type III restriction enzyme
VIKPGRRPSESYIPVPATRKGKVQEELDFETTQERIEKNSLINDLRREMERWRRTNYDGVTPTSRKLLLYWSASPRHDTHASNTVEPKHRTHHDRAPIPAGYFVDRTPD